ncbi:hypothetical protein [Vibrio palustris]|uniref:Uncharacterized protein n=1 Tax=Vibrio palustris TaxID=1918946 RepID=A0A1R4B6A8_9VIBR|nr:hypothetical protein [Vibrio palustris]SJL84449.1 hypothetical protein VPAL9027_02433 [Vibrio palustris]
MIENDSLITTLDELETFLIQIESGGLSLNNAAGVALATDNKSGKPFVAVLDDKHQLLLGRWVTQEIAETGADMVRNGPSQRH